jgi:pimeloyl-ACP methyl ester carboxylesterase
VSDPVSTIGRCVTRRRRCADGTTTPISGGTAQGRVGFVDVTNLAYDDRGTGEPVIFIAGQGGAGRTWHLHQVPAFLAAGYRAITFDNRGVGATENAEGFTTQTMVADTAELIESLGAAPARVVGVSMGAFIAQELMTSRPELVSKAVLMATRGRLDHVRQFFRKSENELAASKTQLPASYDARIRLLENFSPKTLNDDTAVDDWIAMFTMWPTKPTPGSRCQLDVAPLSNRLPAYRNITAPVLVIGFADDLMTPPHLCREVADAIPNGRYLQIGDTGHLGFLERPQEVNAAMLRFLAGPAGIVA